MDKKNSIVNINNGKIRRNLSLLILYIGMFSIITISGCINPVKEVPVIKVNIMFADNQSTGIVDAKNYTLTPGTVMYINRPVKTQADSFPAIASRVIVTDSNHSVIGPWEMTNYTGSGTYTYNIGFPENYYPTNKCKIHVTIMAANQTGGLMGYVVENIKWAQ